MVADRRLPLFLAVVLLAGMLLVLAVLPMPRENLFWRSLFDATHVPVYGGFALMVRLLLDWARGRRSLLHDLAALLLTAGVGAATEVAQGFVGRNAAVMDLVRDLLGAVAVLAGARAVAGWPRPVLLRSLLAMVALALAAGALYPPVQGVLAYRQRDEAFPDLVRFGTEWTARFVDTRNVALDVVPPPPKWNDIEADRVGRLDFRTTEYPAFIVREPHPDWSGHENLVLEFFNGGAEDLSLLVRIDDLRHNGSYTDRYGGRIAVVAGSSVVEIPLAEVRTAPRGREMDLSRIRSLTLFADRPKQPLRVYLGGIHLR